MLLGPTQPAPQATQLILVVNLASFVLMEKKYRNIVSVAGESKLHIGCDCHCSIFAD